MKAACYHGLQDVRVDEVQEPTMLNHPLESKSVNQKGAGTARFVVGLPAP